MTVPTEISQWLDSPLPDKNIERAAVKSVLAELQRIAPGKSVELRIPPYAAVQIVEGPAHRRGTPSAVVEMPAAFLIRLAAGVDIWRDLAGTGKLLASGERSDLSEFFPIWK